VPSLSLSGVLSPAVSNLTNLQSLLLQNNDLSGPIPDTIGNLKLLQALDLSNNQLTGEIPESLGNLMNLNYMRLNNNNLSGSCPESLSNIRGLSFLDLSFNNLSGPIPSVSARTFDIDGNPLICNEAQSKCSVEQQQQQQQSLAAVSLKKSGEKKEVVIAMAVSCLGVISIMVVVGFLIWWRKRPNQQIFFETTDCEVNLGHLRKYTLRELKLATDSFNPRNVVGKGGSGVVYKGRLQDGEVVAVKCLRGDHNGGNETQFRTEVKLIGLAVHRNLLRLLGFCSAENERILVYPYMPNGSVASRLKDEENGRPVLAWSRRKRIAVGTARGLAYLHEQCDPKVIHRDVKAANILLDQEFEAVVGDFGLAKLLDHRDSHVTTAVRGTVGHIAPEYLSTGQSSEKTDVYGFGILLLELITGQKAVELAQQVSHKGAILDLMKKLYEEGELGVMVDKSLMNEFDPKELQEMTLVALLCTQVNPMNRPRMFQVLRMLEGDGIVEKWDKSLEIGTSITTQSSDLPPPLIYGDYVQESSHVVEAMELSGPR
ncbi:hypothetical protein M569_14812, partial [Genlisea aurea]